MGFSRGQLIEDEAENTDNNDKLRPKRQKLPDYLIREEVVLNPDSTCPCCGGDKFRKIDDDVSEVLEYVPSSYKVICYLRPRCACIKCDKIVQSYPAEKAIAKGKATAGLLAHILVQKYCNHLPSIPSIRDLCKRGNRFT